MSAFRMEIWKYPKRDAEWIRGGPVPESRSDDGFAFCSLALTSFPKYLRFNALSSRRSLYARTKLISVRAIFAISPSIVGVRIQRTHTHTHFRHGRLKACHNKRMGWPLAVCASAFAIVFFFVSLFGQFKISQVFAQSGVLVSMLAVECWLVGGLRMHWINKRSVCNDAMLYARPGNHHTLTSQIYGLPRTSNFIIYNSITAIVGIVSAVRSLCMPISGFIYSCSSFYMFLFFLFHSFALIRCRTTKYFVGQRFHIWLGKVFKQKPDNTIADVIEWNWAKISCRSLALRRW